MWSRGHLDILAMSHVDRGAHRLDREHMSQVSAAISSSADAGMGVGGAGRGGDGGRWGEEGEGEGGGQSMKQKLRWNLVYKDK